MLGVKDGIFGRLVCNPPTTVQGFVTVTTNMERAMLARETHYQRHPGVDAPSSSGLDHGSSLPEIRKIIREVVRDDLKKVLPTAGRPASLSIAEVVQEQVQRAFEPNADSAAATQDFAAACACAQGHRRILFIWFRVEQA